MRRLAALLAFCTAVAITGRCQVLTTLVNFNGTNGMYPVSTLVQGWDGNFYGTTEDGGNGGDGTVFKVTPQGVLTTLHVFCLQQDCADGQRPRAGLVQARDGNFYGTTSQGGGVNSFGTVFKITPQGELTTLHSFGSNEGNTPIAPLVQGTDGDFYGTTSEGGAWGDGTVFKITPEGELTTFHSFYISTDGGYPFAGLIQATDGNLYGTTFYSENYGRGTVFKITPQGSLTILHSFDVSEGAGPRAPLIQATDGSFYSTTVAGGANNSGTVFKMTAGGALTTIHSFCALQYCTDGDAPVAALVQGSDGNFYGTTPTGALDVGNIFKITPGGALTVLHTFLWQDGSAPAAGLIQTADGNFYGTTEYGGPNSDGNVFRFDSGLFAPLLLAKSGNGIVSSSDRDIYCGTLCAYPYPKNTQVALSAVPASGYTFSGWTGCDNVNGSYCSVTMTGPKNMTATFTPANITLTSLTFKPSYVKGGQLSAGTLTLSVPAPSGGLAVALSSDHPGVAHPPSFVLVPGNARSVQFAVQTFPVKSNTTVSITATAGASEVSGTLMVGTTSLPPSLK